jgi:hypothetical protein
VIPDLLIGGEKTRPTGCLSGFLFSLLFYPGVFGRHLFRFAYARHPRCESESYAHLSSDMWAFTLLLVQTLSKKYAMLGEVAVTGDEESTCTLASAHSAASFFRSMSREGEAHPLGIHGLAYVIRLLLLPLPLQIYHDVHSSEHRHGHTEC